MLPAVGAAVMLLLIYTIETFEVPLLLGGRAQVRVYTTEIYFNTSRTPTDWGLSGAYSIAILFFCAVFLAIYFRLVRHGERYQTVTGKDFRPRRIDLGRWRYVTCALSLLLVFLITGLPFLVMLYASLLRRYQPPSLAVLQNLSLNNYHEILRDPVYSLDPMWNSTLGGTGLGDGGHASGFDHELFCPQDAHTRPKADRLFRFCTGCHSERGTGHGFFVVLLAGSIARPWHAHHHLSRLCHPLYGGGAALRVDIDAADS